MKKVSLTGIKPTGMPHIGNYFGAIKPAIDLSQSSGQAFYFMADWHSLTTVKDPKVLGTFVREVACTWLACGLDTDKVVFYRQSDIQEVFELCTILTNVTPKGLMNRAHAYKAMIQDGKEDEVNIGLFIYPILQAADIMIMDATHVPVGQDQKQHIEIAAGIARSFNAIYGDVLTVTQPVIKEDVAVVPGLDGRKMSKSYNNHIPLFCSEADLKKCIMRITTDSSLPTDPKPLDHPIFQMYKLLATTEEVKDMKKKFEKGIGWGDAKAELFRVANRELTPMRDKYNHLIENYATVETLLAKGATKAREVAKKTLDRVKAAICK